MAKRPSRVRVFLRYNKWAAQISSWHGRPYHESFDTEVEARNWAAEATYLMSRGLDPKAATATDGDHLTKRRGGKTIRDLLDHVIERDYSSGRAGDEKARIALRIACQGIGMDARVAALTYEKIDDALRRQGAERSNSLSTVNKRRVYVNILLERAQRLGWIDRVVRLDKVAAPRNNRRFRITPNLETAMLEWAMAHQGEHGLDWYDFLVLSIYLGQRENVTLRIRLGRSMAAPSDAWVEDDAVIFPRGASDNKEQRYRGVPIREIVGEVINRRRAAGDSDARIFRRLQSDRMTNPGAPLSAAQWKKWVDATFAAMKADLLGHPEVIRQQREGMPLGKDFCPHIGRTEFISRLADEGYDATEIARYTGHKTLGVIEGYIVDERKTAWRQSERRAGKLADGLPPAPVPSFAPTQPLRVILSKPKPVAPAPRIGAGGTIDPHRAVVVVESLVAAGQLAVIDSVMAGADSDWIAALAIAGRPDLIQHIVAVPSFRNG